MTTSSVALPPLAIETADEVFGAIPASDVAAALYVREVTLVAWRRRGHGPPSLRLGPQVTLYPTEPLRRWWASPDARRTRRRVLRRSPA
jgi:hypothetical protein